MSSKAKVRATALGALLLAAPLGCQERQEPTTTLTQAQWEEVRAQILPAAPAQVQHKVGADFGGQIRLIGLDVEPAGELKAGQEVTVTWYWEALSEMSVNWQVFVHFDHKGPPPTRQGMDHHPVRELYQTSRWKKGQVVKDVQKVTLRSDYPGGEAIFWVGLWNQSSGQRLELTNGGQVANDGDHRVKAAVVKVAGRPGGAAPDKGERPRVYAARSLEGALTIDGKLDEEAWQKQARPEELGGTRGGPGPAGKTWVKVLHDAEHLYLGIHAEDTDAWGSLTERDAQTWTEEVVEIFIDPDGDAKDYIELQVTPNNVIFDARFPVKLGRGEGSREAQIDQAKAWNSQMTTAVFVDGVVNDAAAPDKSWSVELKIPFADLPGGAPAPGAQWKVNFYRFDAPRVDGKAQRQVAWAWSPPAGSFHNVERFGTLRFVGAGGSIEVRPPAEVKPPQLPPQTPPPGDGEIEPDKPE